MTRQVIGTGDVIDKVALISTCPCCPNDESKSPEASKLSIMSVFISRVEV